MVSGKDVPLHRQRTQPGQTRRARANHQTSPPTMSRIVPGSQYHADNYEAAELSVLRHKEWQEMSHENDDNDSNWNDGVHGRDVGGAGPCSAARADHAGGLVQGSRNA